MKEKKKGSMMGNIKEEIIKATFIQNIQYLINRDGIPAAKLAEICDVNRSTVSNWLHLNSFPTLLAAYRISEYYKISLDNLLSKNIRDEDNKPFQGYYHFVYRRNSESNSPIRYGLINISDTKSLIISGLNSKKQTDDLILSAKKGGLNAINTKKIDLLRENGENVNLFSGAFKINKEFSYIYGTDSINDVAYIYLKTPPLPNNRKYIGGIAELIVASKTSEDNSFMTRRRIGIISNTINYNPDTVKKNFIDRIDESAALTDIFLNQEDHNWYIFLQDFPSY